MYQSSYQLNKKEFKTMNFSHLMSIYETNYRNFRAILDNCETISNRSTYRRPITIEDIFHDKFTRIFKIYHKFKYQDSPSPLNMFSIKPHLIFYMYDDAKLLEVKSLRDNKTFENSIQKKIRLNLNLFYWIKSYIKQ